VTKINTGSNTKR